MKTELHQDARALRKEEHHGPGPRIGIGFEPAPVPPEPKRVDPHGPQESMWPRGWFNFGNIVLAIGIAAVVLIVALAAPLFFK